MLKILYIGLKFDYGVPSRGYSFEFLNIYDTLTRMNGIQANLFPFDEIMRSVGRAKMNSQLLQTIDEVKPDLCFFSLFTDEIEKSTLKKISERDDTVTLNWFADDHWRFISFSRFWAPFFTWIVTTDKESIGKYNDMGLKNVLLSQWGFNHNVYKSADLPYEYDTTFVGQVHSRRLKFIRSLRNENINVSCWGSGWPAGRVAQNEMIKIYSKSKINLNFADSSPGFQFRPVIKTIITRRADDTFRINSAGEVSGHIKTLFSRRGSQIKARNFEITGTGGFLLAQYTPHLESYFQPDKEIAIFYEQEDLLEKTRFYLKNDDIRENIRQKGYERALREHTFEARLRSIISGLGLQSKMDKLN
jgi:spore maturation protein CgeB